MNRTLADIAALDERFHFCEDLEVSGAVDFAGNGSGAGAATGLLVGVKSNIRVAGQAWTAGIGSRASQVAATDAKVVAMLREAGAVILSRLAMDEGALGAATDNPHFGRCDNPAFPGHSAGGSSGGSAAAVAAGAVDAALGSDTMGSVRIPAAYCGVFGLKLGHGAVPMDGVFPLAPSLDSLGILARSPARISQVLSVLMPELGEGGEISAWVAPDEVALEGCDANVLAFFGECRDALRDLLGPASISPEMDLARIRSDAFLLTEVEAVETLGEQPGLSPFLQKLIAYGRGVSSERLSQVRERLRDTSRALHSALGENSVLLLPTVSKPAFVHGERPPADQADFTTLANVAGCPAIAIPKPGSVPPVSAQLVGPMGSERRLVDLAEKLSDKIK